MGVFTLSILFYFVQSVFADTLICQVTKDGLPPYPEVITEIKEGKLIEMKERHSKSAQMPPQFIEFEEYSFELKKEVPFGVYNGKRKDGYTGTLTVIDKVKTNILETDQKELFNAEYSRTSNGAKKNYSALCGRAE